MFQKLIFGGGSFYNIFIGGIFADFLHNMAMLFSKHGKHRFRHSPIFYSAFGWLENKVVPFLHSKTNLHAIFIKRVFDFMADFILVVQIPCAQSRYTAFQVVLKYP